MLDIMYTLSFLLATLLTTEAEYSSSNYQNVYGNELSSCSELNNNMALTGYTRSGSCVEYQDDYGSHHICIDLSSNTGGNFCDVTGQNDWCSSYMQCDTGDAYKYNDDDENTCPVKYWCVCQWAFASYIEKAGGCDYIQDIKCDAVNMQAAVAYTALESKDDKYKNALECIEQRCNVNFSNLYNSSNNSKYAFSRKINTATILFAALSVTMVGLVFMYYKQKRSLHVTIPDVKEPFTNVS